MAAAAGTTLIPGIDAETAAAIDARRAQAIAAGPTMNGRLFRTGASRRPRGRILRLLGLAMLCVPLLVGSIATYASPPPTRGDELSDALASQKALAAKIKAQKAEVAQLDAMQATLATEIGSTKTALAGVNADLTSVQQRVTKMTADVKAVQATLKDLVTQLNALKLQLVEVTLAEQAKAAELADRQAVLAERLQAAYEAGSPSLLEVVLSADSFTDALGDVSNALALGDRDRQLADQIAADQATLAVLHQNTADTAAATDQLRVQTAAQQASLAAKLSDLKLARAQLKVLQAETKRQLALQKAAYQKLAQNKVAAAKLLEKEAATQRALKKRIADLVAAQYRDGNIPSVYNGSFIWPIAGVVTQEFGCTGFWAEPPLGNCAHFHTGIDIADPMYTPIHAAGAGRVVYEGPLSDGAWVVIIAHSAELVTLYGHLDNRRHPPIVRAGQFVQQGQIIGYVGITGHSTGPHLHWGVELNGTWVNPRLFV